MLLVGVFYKQITILCEVVFYDRIYTTVLVSFYLYVLGSVTIVCALAPESSHCELIFSAFPTNIIVWQSVISLHL